MYDAFMGGLKSLVFMPWTIGRWLMHFSFMKKISYYTVQSRILSNFVYLVKVSGLKIKFLWDTLNHYFLLMSILRLMWKEKAIVGSVLSLLSYYLYFRG